MSKRGRKLKYKFDDMTVGGEPMKGLYTIVSCAINWARYNGKDWKFKSERHGNDVFLYRIS